MRPMLRVLPILLTPCSSTMVTEGCLGVFYGFESSEVTRAAKSTSRHLYVPDCRRRTRRRGSCATGQCARRTECPAEYVDCKEQHGSDAGWNVDGGRGPDEGRRDRNVDTC